MKTNNFFNKEKLLKNLEKKELEIHEYIGVICLTIYSTEIFKSNKEVEEFISEVFKIKYLEYVIKSRSLIVARISKDVLKFDEVKIRESKRNFKKYMMIQIPIQEKKKKKMNANDKLSMWLKGL